MGCYCNGFPPIKFLPGCMKTSFTRLKSCKDCGLQLHSGCSLDALGKCAIIETEETTSYKSQL